MLRDQIFEKADGNPKMIPYFSNNDLTNQFLNHLTSRGITTPPYRTYAIIYTLLMFLYQLTKPKSRLSLYDIDINVFILGYVLKIAYWYFLNLIIQLKHISFHLSKQSSYIVSKRRLCNFFSAIIATFITRINYQRKHFIVLIFIFLLINE